MTDRKLLVSAGPHVRGGASTTSVMGDVLIALLPAVVASVLVFGTRALLLEVVCVAASILFEYLFRKITKRTNTISDLSAAVTGLLLAMNLPAGFPIWMAIVGCFVAIVIVKQLFGGIGCNFANPAITGRIFLLIAFAGQMTTWPTANSYIPGIDAVSGATPLALIKEGAVDSLPAVKNLLFGIRGGCLGETCAIALIIGFVYLVVRRVITPTIPLVYVATIALMSVVLGYDPIYMILTGGVLLGGIGCELGHMFPAYRLLHLSRHRVGQGRIRAGRGHHHHAHPQFLRRLSGGRILRHSAYEYHLPPPQ